jgi:5-formyltetrahydrofolate cyclo-ligase
MSDLNHYQEAGKGAEDGGDWRQQRSRIRAEVRVLRRSFQGEARATATAEMVGIFRGLPEFLQAQRVAGFLAFDGEADPGELMRIAIGEQKQVFVPVIVGKHQPLRFCPWNPQIVMRKNNFGIDEPDVSPEKWIDAAELDFVICPLVAFDPSCHRLGVGGGYYDRSFRFLNGHTNPAMPVVPTVGPQAPLLAGFAFELQKVSSVQAQPWDVVLDLVITEKKIYRRDQKTVGHGTH